MWTVTTTDLFDQWFDQQDETLQDRFLAGMNYIRLTGPGAGRPFVDAIKGSRYFNMKKLRVQFRGDPLRAFFAFDPFRCAVMLCAGCKSSDEKRFYSEMIPIADEQLRKHLLHIEGDHG